MKEKKFNLFELTNEEVNSPSSKRRVLFSVSEKVSLQKLVLQYRIHTKHLNVASRKIAWARLTQDFNSIKGYCRTEAQLKKCWDNIKTRRRFLLGHQAQTTALQSHEERTQDEELDLPTDPLMPVKQETSTWNHVHDNDSDTASKEFEVAEVSLGATAPASPPSDSSRLVDDVFHHSPHAVSRLQGPKPEDRGQERLEELHKLKIAEQVWTLKTLRERHATAQLERERAQLEREKARFERDVAEFQKEKALLELDRVKRAVTDYINK